MKGGEPGVSMIQIVIVASKTNLNNQRFGIWGRISLAFLSTRSFHFAFEYGYCC